MALLHYLYKNAERYGIVLSALNCDHGIRGASSARDSAFVEKWCREHKIPLRTFKTDCTELAEKRRVSVETAARDWRLFCYFRAAEAENACIATAHHMDDNAETVLFNIARGSSLSGAAGLKDVEMRLDANVRNNQVYAPWECESELKCTLTFQIVRPLINCTRSEIDEYINENKIPFVDDETNFTQDYTRNKIRMNVMPELENAVHGAAANIFRFSRLAGLSVDFIEREALSRVKITLDGNAALIAECGEYVLFAHCAVFIIKEWFRKKDYTLSHVDALFGLQSQKTGKKYEFLGLTAYSENGRIAICEKQNCSELPFGFGRSMFSGRLLTVTQNRTELPLKTVNGEYVYLDASDKFYNTAEGEKFGCKFPLLKFDADAVPETAVIRTAKAGDKFKKFGGGTKSLGDFFTDKKIPVRLRKTIPLIADGNEILAVCGVEISDKIKVTPSTAQVGFIVYSVII